MEENLLKKLSEAFAILNNQDIYYYSFLSRVTKKIVKYQDIGAPACVTYNKKTLQVEMWFSDLLVSLVSPTELYVAIKHEAEHLITDDFKIFFSMILKDGDSKTIEKKKHAIWNLARDYKINDSIDWFRDNYNSLIEDRDKLKELRKEIVNKGDQEEILKFKVKYCLYFSCLFPDIKKIEGIDGRNSDEISSIDIFNALYKNDSNSSDNSKSDTINESKPLDRHSDDMKETQQGEATDGGDEFVSVPSYVIDDMLIKAKEELDELGHGAGKISNSAKLRLENIQKSKNSFKREIMCFYQSATSCTKRRTWSRPHRKYQNLLRGKKYERSANLIVWDDTSGSQWSVDTQSKIVGVINSLLKINKNLTVLVGDTELKSVSNFKTGKFSLNKISITGGGGTSPQFVYDYAIKNKADGVILLTDGDFNSEVLKTYGIKSLAILVGSHTMKVNGIKNVVAE